MTKIVNVYQAKTHLSQLMERAVKGEEIRIGKYGRPMVKLVPDIPVVKKRVPGLLAGRGYWMSDDFNETPPEVIEALEQSLEEDLA